jgi:hypothetical protein
MPAVVRPKLHSLFSAGRFEVSRIVGSLVALTILLAAASAPVLAAEHDSTATPAQLVASYNSLADTILSAKKTEWNLVDSILATTYGHGEAVLAQIREKQKAGKDAKAETEKLATLVSYLGNEGDSAVAGVRKRLVEGGHHHHATAEQQGKYDEGFVIVTRTAKKVFLDAAGQIGKLAAAPNAAALEAEWQKVRKQYQELTAK